MGVEFFLSEEGGMDTRFGMYGGMGRCTRGCGWMTCSMGTGGKKCQMEVHLKDSLLGGGRMATVSTDGPIRQCTRGSGSRVRSTDVELMSGPMDEDMTVSGAKTNSTVRVSTSGLMVVSTQEVT